MALTSEVYLCKNTKLFPGSEDSYYFASETARKNFFVGKSSNALHFTGLSFIRENRPIRLNVNYETAEECDYLIFCNSAYTTKWIYCFIAGVSYVNDNVTDITFMVDPIQTWLPSCTLSNCMVERDTLNTDTKWSAIQNIEDFIKGSMFPTAKGDLMSAISPDTSYSNEYVCVVSNAAIGPAGYQAKSFIAKFNDRYGKNCGRGDNLIYYIFNTSVLTGNTAVSKCLANLVTEAVSGELWNDKYRVFNVCMVPELCLPTAIITALKASVNSIGIICPDTGILDDTIGPGDDTIRSAWANFYSLNSISGGITASAYTSTPKDQTLAISWSSASTGIFENYTAKNNKLFNAPYTKLRILNNMGEAMDLSPEYFGGFTRQPQDLTFYFKVFGFLSISPDLVLFPMDYLGSGSATINPNYRISIAPYPQLPYNEDSFTQWLQQNNIANSIKGAQGLLQVGMGIAGIAASGGTATPVATGMIASGAMSLAALGQSFGQAKSNGISTNIPNNSGAVASGLNLHKFSWQLLSLRYYDANSCDDYLSKYGYAFNGFKTPSFTKRTKWDYVKTSGAGFSSAPVPAPAQAQILDRLNAGLRLWKGDYLGNYNQTNAIA